MDGTRHNWLMAAVAAAALNTGAYAETPRFDFDLRPQPLKYALRAVTRTGGLELLATSDELEGRRAPALAGRLTVEEALDALLAGSGLSARIQGETVTIRGRDTLQRGFIFVP